ncbi:MAG: S-adenosyl-l-methionine hydroxide adenosyltransferase family protein, partial [Nitrospinota bacterium]
MSNIITIISDFGLQDPFVGIMKGVMLGIAPQLRFIDLTHQVPPQDLYHTFFALQSAYSYFPKGTVHLVVVDPGVGGTRRAIAIESDGHYFVGPDNGVFSFLYNKKNLPCRVIELNHEKYFLQTVSQTFQGRDLFAPVAACLAKG